MALAENNSARELMQQNGESKLRELAAVVLTQKVRENATLDMEFLATDRVMEQASSSRISWRGKEYSKELL